MLPKIYQIPKVISIYRYLFLLKALGSLYLGRATDVATKDANEFVTINNKFRTLVKNTRNSLEIQWLGFLTFSEVAWVQSLAREHRSHKPSCVAKKKKSAQKMKFIFKQISKP